jgi:leader peptidase (prepilin peptidase)/N-methyltransferase
MELIIFLYGLVIGSFLNVCIYRIPLGMSIAFPPSFCPDCRNRLKWHEMIPLASYLVLRGRCRNCRAVIKVQYPLVELSTAVLSVLIFMKFGLTGIFFKYIIFVDLLIVVSFIDIQCRRIPNILSVSGIIVGLLWSCFHGGNELFHAVLGLAVGGAVLFPVAYFYPQGMGMGDIKLLAMIGAFTGVKLLLLALFGGSALGAITGLILICCKVITRKTPIPFGPFLAAGAVAAILLCK